MVKIFLNRYLVNLIILITGSSFVFAQSAGDFRSAATGNWSDVSVWESFDGSAWGAAASYPTSSDGIITIQNGHTITIDIALTVDQVNIQTGGTVTTSNGVGISINGTENVVNGTLAINGGASVNAGTIQINSGSFSIVNGSISATQMVFDGTSSLTLPAGSVFGVNTTLIHSGTTTLSCSAVSATIGGEIDVAADEVGAPAATLTIASGCSVVLNGDIKVRPTGIINGAGTLIYTGLSQSTGFINNGTVNVDVVVQQSAGITPFLSATADHTPSWNNIEINAVDGVKLNQVYLTPSITIKGTLKLTKGTFDFNGFAVVLGNSAKIIRSGGSLSTAPTFGTAVDVTYSGTSAITTGNELPSSGSVLTNLVIDNSGGVTLNADNIVNGTLSISSGCTLSDGGYTLTAKGNIANSGIQNGTGKIVLSGGASAHTLSGGGSFGNITLNDAYGASLTGNITVNGTLTLTSGTIATASNSVIVAASGTVARTDGYIAGKLQKNIPTGSSVSSLFEIGDASQYTPVTITFASVTTTGNLAVSTTAGEFASASGSNIDVSKDVNRSWKITNSATVFTTYDITFNFVSGDIDAGASTASFIVGKYDASVWSLPTVGTKTSTSTQATGLTSFSDFIIGEMATATQIAVSAGNNQTATVGTAVAVLPSVVVKDGNDNPVSGVSVTFAVASGGGTATGLSATTDASGIAVVGSWTLGTTAGSNTLTATSAGLTGSPVTFTASATPGAADHLIFSTQPSGADASKVLDNQPVVYIVDSHGNLTDATNDVVLSLTTWPSGATVHELTGTTTITASGGVATFSGLKVNTDDISDNFGLTATVTGLPTPSVASGFWKFGLLPVELSTFSAAPHGEKVKIEWETKTEVNSSRFEIERRKGNIWETIGSQAAAGVSNGPRKYSYTDQAMNMNQDRVLYRLKAVDHDGGYTYSSEVEVSVVPSRYGLEQNYPNPFNPTTKIQYSIPEGGRVRLVVYDVLGREIAELANEEEKAGYYEKEFRGSKMSSGVYFYRLTVVAGGKNTFTHIKKMILMK